MDFFYFPFDAWPEKIIRSVAVYVFLLAAFRLTGKRQVGQLSPFDPLMFAMQGMMALAHLCAGRCAEAADWADKACLERPNVLATLRGAVVSNALAGRQQEAEKALARLLALDPDLRVSDVRNRTGSFGRPEDLARYEEGLRKAGLPE
jgi:adenylate cyclase